MTACALFRCPRYRLYRRHFRKAWARIQEGTTWVLIVALTLSQVQFAPTAEAASPGTSSVSAGSAPPPSASTVESFQPELFTGRANAGVPIGIPPGRKNMQPQLALSYGSSGRNGWVGAGWNLEMGCIERSTKFGVPSYTELDCFTFQLGGGSSEMVKLADGTYRAEDEGLFMKFEHLGTNGWQVTDKGGTRYLLGRTDSSRVEDGTRVFRWCLEEVIGPHGNTMEILYEKTNSVVSTLREVRYTGHTSGTPAAANRVVFYTEPRPDVSSSYRSGFELALNRRLSRIETYASGSGTEQLATRYDLAYRQSARTGQSLLASVTPFGFDGESTLPPRTFTYQESDAPAYEVTLKRGSGSQIAWNVRTANADMGHDNFGCVEPYAGLPWGTPVVVSNSYGFGGVSVTVGSRGQISMNGSQDHFVHAWTAVYVASQKTITLTKAGNWDVCCLYLQDTGYPYPVPLGSVTLKAGWTVIHLVGYHQHDSFSCGLANALADQVDLMSPNIITEPQMAADVDGNGINDLISFKNGAWNVSLASSAGTLAPPQTWLTGFGDNGYAPLVGDWNADGRADVALYSNGVWRFATSSGSNFTANGLASTTFSVGQPIAGDFNGDGVVDLGTYKDGQWKVALGSGLDFGATPSFDTTISEGAPVLAASDVRWTVRMWARDCAHDNAGCFYPYGMTMCGGASWSTALVGPSMVSVGGGQSVVGSQGNVMCYAGQDRFFWASTAIYLSAGKTLSLGNNSGWDVACLYKEPKGGSVSAVSAGSLGSVSFPQGWSKIHFTGYNQNQGISAGVNANIRGQVDIMAPDYIEENISSAQHITGDFNGDGLTDVAVIKDQQVYPALSTGTQLVRAGTWSIPFGDKDYTTADYNGDGLTDIAWYDRATGKVKVVYSTGQGLGTTVELPLTFSLRLAHDQIQVGEWNGDGLPDLCIIDGVSGDIEMAYSQGTTADLLVRIENGLGGVGELTYQPSTRMNNTFLPMIMPLVTETRATSGLGDTNVTSYMYAGGLYDSSTKEFRGFGHVEVRNAEGTASVTDFHQDYQRKGRPYRQAVYDVNGNQWTREERTYDSTIPYAGRSAFFTHLDQVDSYTFDGDLTSRQTRVRHTYDEYGNLKASYSDGEMEQVGDERSTITTYVVNTNAWILNTASLVQTFDADGMLKVQFRTYYDGAEDPSVPPVKGNITREEKWLDQPVEQWVASHAEYDAYGNLSVARDAMGYAVSNTYDATFTFITRAENALGHQRVVTCDPRTGQVLAVTDQNQVVGFTSYDVFGRKISEGIVHPVTGQTNVQAETEYRIDTVPTRVKTTLYTQPDRGGARVSYLFLDGWGRKVQVRESAENPGRQNISGAATYDGQGRMIRQWSAYEDAWSEEYVPHTAVPGLAPPEQYTYDPIGRLLTTTFPNGSVSSVAYDDWTTTYTDSKNHIRRMTHDAYGQVNEVEEVNGDDTYITQYAYDIHRHVIAIKDHFDHKTRASYDSLGRKIATDDPDLGQWTYTYNANDLMTRQTDARGVSVLFTYDALNRLVRKDYEVPASISPLSSAVYTYDEAGVPYSTGRLTRVADASGQTRYAYDYMNRVIRETRVIEGATNAIQNVSDLSGRLVSYTYPNGHVASYTYNAAGGVETVSLQAGAARHTIISNINYNAAGKVVRMEYGNGVVSDYTYNPQTLKLAQKHSTASDGVVLQDFAYARDAVGNIESITDTVNTGTQHFQYDPLNRLVQATGASYGTQAFAYDAIGNMTSKAGVSMTYGGAVRPHAVTATSAGLALLYDANGNMTGRVSSASGRMDLRFDAENRLAEMQITPPPPPTSVSLLPGMNLVGFPSVNTSCTLSNALKQFGSAYVQITRLRAADQQFESCVGQVGVDQFTTLTPGDGYWVCCTNASGATMTLPSASGTPAPRTLNAGWRLLAGPSAAMSVGAWLTPLTPGTDYGVVKGYDTASGSFAAVDQVVPGKAYYVQILKACTWTPRTAGSGPQMARYLYNADGARVKQTVDGEITLFLGADYEVRGGTTMEYVMNGYDRVASLDSAGTLRYYLSDHLNSANLIVDTAGHQLTLAEYAPYGQLSRFSGAADTPYKFTGQRLDATSGLYFMGARCYDPELGRFISPDTIVPDSFDPQTLNRYSYARNNPILFSDPSGNIFIIDDILIPMLIAAFWGAVINVAMAAIMGGDLGQAALTGAASGAITWGFGAIGESLFSGAKAMQYLGRAGVNAIGGAASGAAGAAIKGEPIGKGALAGFKSSTIMSAANFAVGQWSGYSKSGQLVSKKGSQGADGFYDMKINGINTKLPAIDAELAHCDEFIYNMAGEGWDGALKDVVECAQEIFFGPSSFSRELGGYLKGFSGVNVSIVAHSQGTIMTTRGLQLAGRSGTRFGDQSTITFNNPPMDPVSAYGAAWSCGISHVAYRPDPRDFVSGIGNLVYMPTSLPFLPWLGDFHCAYSYENAFSH